MSTFVTPVTSSSNNNSTQWTLPRSTIEDEFEFSQYICDIIASKQCQQVKQQWHAESTPHPNRNSPSTAADGPQNKGARQSSSPDPLLRLPGNPCRSLVLWRADRRVSLVSSSPVPIISGVTFTKIWRNEQERERTKAF